jgi:sulfite reductase beta subunit-like hemoprotein
MARHVSPLVGVYTQGDGQGVLGGSKGEGESVPYLMLRIRLTNGIVRSDQLRTIANVSERYARGLADITVRQNIQLHWIRVETCQKCSMRCGARSSRRWARAAMTRAT